MNKIYDKSGVYALIAIERKLIYIGSTKNFRIRKNIHKSTLKKKDLRRCVNGLIEAHNNNEFIDFQIIEQCDNYLEREQYWIEFYKNHPIYTLINVFDADRQNSNTTNDFKEKMRLITRERWKDPIYREKVLLKSVKGQFTSEKLNKTVYQFSKNGEFINKFNSSKEAAHILKLNPVCIGSAARGIYCNKHLYKNFIFIYDEVLYKLDELLETHQELRAISSQAWEACKSTKKVQRLMDE